MRKLARIMSTHEHNVNFKKDFTVTKEENSSVKITGEIPYEELLKERSAAIKALGKNIELDGFRKGHVPETVLVKHIGEMVILNEMAERTLSHFYPHILETHKIDAIGYPKIEITKLAPNNPLAFTATVAILPVFELPNYQSIADGFNQNKTDSKVTNEELETKIKDILRQKTAYEKLQKKATNAESTDLPTPETVEKEEVLELTDELVKTLGQPGQFNTVDEFKSKLREHLEIEKAREVKAEHRVKITDAIIEATEMQLPQVLIDSELQQMFAQMEEDLKRSNLKLEDYFKHIKKTKEELQKEWSPAAEKRAKLQLILNEIAKKEDIKPNQELVEKQVKELLEIYKDADVNRVRTYVSTILVNEAVLTKLEGEEK